MSAVTKAVIPAAGLGTRMEPVSRVVPKELLPVGSKPAIQWVIEEAAAAGLTELAIVLSPTKGLLFEYLADGGLDSELGVRFQYVTQDVQRGLADAMWQCRDFTDGEPFALLLPDNVLLSREHSLSRMVSLYARNGRDVIGALELDHSHSGQFGNCGLIDFERKAAGVLEISHLRDKRPGRLAIEEGATVVRACGRYICHAQVFEYMKRFRPGGDNNGSQAELDEVPVYQAIIEEKGALGCLLSLPLFDVGYPAGYAAANGYWARHLAPSPTD
ncbi:MAG: NTP transferase domain-containing protein [bacterium]|nr:NTP transferase domain-containing protein [bacterium]